MAWGEDTDYKWFQVADQECRMDLPGRKGRRRPKKKEKKVGGEAEEIAGKLTESPARGLAEALNLTGGCRYSSI